MPASHLEPPLLMRPAAPIALRADHLPQAVELSRALNWPYRLEDWAFAHALGRGFAVEIDGRLSGTGLWWAYGDQHGSVGMIIVAPQAQRRGIGLALMDALLTDAAERTLVLNSTAEGLKLYTRLGFAPIGAVRQHQGVLLEAPPVDPAVVIREFREHDLAAIQRLDRLGRGMDRGALIEALLSVGTFKVIARDGEVSGYGCVRRWGRGVVVGPIVAQDAYDARALIAALAARHIGDFVRIDVTAAGGLSPWLHSIGLLQVNEVVEMGRGGFPRTHRDVSLFALCNQSFG